MSTLAPDTIQQKFTAFHHDNPWVYEQLVAMARDLKRRGRHKAGINMLWEVLRWRTFTGTVDAASDFRLNDHYPSRYARLIQANCPDLADFFDVRVLRSP